MLTIAEAQKLVSKRANFVRLDTSIPYELAQTSWWTATVFAKWYEGTYRIQLYKRTSSKTALYAEINDGPNIYLFEAESVSTPVLNVQLIEP